MLTICDLVLFLFALNVVVVCYWLLLVGLDSGWFAFVGLVTVVLLTCWVDCFWKLCRFC